MKFLLNPRLRRPHPDYRVAHLLIVAGPSGSGKSTFLGDLAVGGLATEIVAALPAGASGWPQTNGRRMIRGRLPADENVEQAADGLILHYDFLRPFETAISDYAGDPSLAVLAWADEITVAIVTMPNELLAERLAARPPKPRRIARTIARLLHRAGVETRRKLRRVYDPETEHARHQRLVGLYRTADFLAGWEARWAAYLKRSHGDRLRQPLIRIEAGRRGHSFHLVSKASASGRDDSRSR